MYVSTNKQPINSQNCFNVLPQICQGKRYKNFLTSNIPADNITLCSWQHTARMLRVELLYVRICTRRSLLTFSAIS
jgi:hypothetical protein